jgi:rRNA maturation endonuclease Nob1
LALPHALLLKSNTVALDKERLAQGMKKCPSCAELIRQEAKVCSFCGREAVQARVA